MFVICVLIYNIIFLFPGSFETTPALMVATGGRSPADHRPGTGGGLSHPTRVEAEEAESGNRWVRPWLECGEHGGCGEPATASRTIKAHLR